MIKGDPTSTECFLDKQKEHTHTHTHTRHVPAIARYGFSQGLTPKYTSEYSNREQLDAHCMKKKVLGPRLQQNLEGSESKKEGLMFHRTIHRQV